MNWNFNANDYDPNKTAYELIPIGDYRCRIKGVEEKQTSKEPKRDMIVLELEFAGYATTLKHYVVLDGTSEDAIKRTNQTLGVIFDTFGITQGNMNTQSWIGKAGGARIKHEPYTGNDGKQHTSAKVAYFLRQDKLAELPPWQGRSGAAASAAATPAPSLDEDALAQIMAGDDDELPFA